MAPAGPRSSGGTWKLAPDKPAGPRLCEGSVRATWSSLTVPSRSNRSSPVRRCPPRATTRPVMIERLIALALRFRLAVVAATLALVAGGAWALLRINVDAFPDLTPNQVQVITVTPGLSPNEVENLVSYPMETAMMGLPRTLGVRSISKAGISVVTVSYEDEVDMYFARAQVTQRMQDAMGSLPAGAEP